ncbi:PspC domain-containing protein [Streptomyces sp. RFCAC02]|uniref:PspC domain-containing protein n=1 Tax=Streptomyces sp. RFCAC02 TaxID=2499143 RepID=UPI00143D907E|nr:PspC domain-containing protein [Streptomyces sp. RFCAC02]
MNEESTGARRTETAAPPGAAGGADGAHGGWRWPRPEDWAGLTRSRRHKVVGGVCGGLARKYDLDPVVFRVPLAVLAVVGGLGLVAYGLAWLLIPFDGEQENEGRRLLSGRVDGPGLTALLFVLAGCGLLLASLADTSEVVWFSVLTFGAMAGAAYWSRLRAASADAGAAGAPVDRVAAQAAAEAPPEATAPPSDAPSWWRGQPGPVSTGYLWGPDTGARAAGGGTVPPGDAPAPPGGGAEAAPGRRREARLGALVSLLASFAALIGGVLAWDHEPLRTTLVVALVSALAVYGVGFVVSAFFGRLGGGTVVNAVITAVLLAGASALPENITTDWSEPVWRVSSADDLADTYTVGSGDARLYLTDLEIPAGERVTTSVEAGAGQVTVFVPPEVTVRVHVRLDVGAFTYEPLRGTDDAGPVRSFGGVSEDRTVTYPAQGTEEPGGTVDVSIDLGIGHVSLERIVGSTP